MLPSIHQYRYLVATGVRKVGKRAVRILLESFRPEICFSLNFACLFQARSSSAVSVRSKLKKNVIIREGLRTATM